MSNTLAPASADNAAAPPVEEPVIETPDPAAPPAVDPPADPAAGDPPADADTPAARRIKELVDERNATRDYAEYWRTQATKGLTPPPTPQPSAPTVKPAPTLDQFQDPETKQYDATKWSAAYARWAEEQIGVRAEAIVEQRLTVREQRQQQEQTTTSWQQKCAEFRAKQPDFDVVTANPTLPIPKSVADVIVTLERGPAVFHHLGTNPAEAARIARLPPAQQAVALGRIDERLGATPKTPAPRQQSRAPAPPNPTRGGGSGEINMETCSLDEFLDARMPARKPR